MQKIQIANEVVSAIACTAILEVEGVASVGKHSRKKKGVTLHRENGNVQITADIVVKSGSKIQNVACEVQHKVKNAVETMTGFTASEVNVHVSGLVV